MNTLIASLAAKIGLTSKVTSEKNPLSIKNSECAHPIEFLKTGNPPFLIRFEKNL